jgi:hypothetical protein
MNNKPLIHPTLQKFRDDTLRAIIKNEKEDLELAKKIIPFPKKEN